MTAEVKGNCVIEEILILVIDLIQNDNIYFPWYNIVKELFKYLNTKTLLPNVKYQTYKKSLTSSIGLECSHAD